LVFHNPAVFLKARTQTFLSTFGMEGTDFFDSRPVFIYTHGYKQSFFDEPLSHIFFPQPRMVVFNVLAGVIARHGRPGPSIFYYLFWNLLSPLILCLLLCACAIWQKDGALFFTSACCLLLFAAIFITTPANYIMYYMAVYLCIYCLTMYYALAIFQRRRDLKC